MVGVVHNDNINTAIKTTIYGSKLDEILRAVDYFVQHPDQTKFREVKILPTGEVVVYVDPYKPLVGYVNEYIGVLYKRSLGYDCSDINLKPLKDGDPLYDFISNGVKISGKFTKISKWCDHKSLPISYFYPKSTKKLLNEFAIHKINSVCDIMFGCGRFFWPNYDKFKDLCYSGCVNNKVEIQKLLDELLTHYAIFFKYNKLTTEFKFLTK